MNKQLVFETVAWHLLQQGHRATNGLRCVYRNSFNESCAVGCLIPPASYYGQLEAKDVASLPSSVFAPEYEIDPTDKDDWAFLEQLRMIHDGTAVRFWERDLRSLAIEHGLLMPEG